MPEDSFLYKKIRVLPQPFQSDEGVGISNIHQDMVNLLDISLVEKNAINTPWQTNEQLHEH